MTSNFIGMCQMLPNKPTVSLTLLHEHEEFCIKRLHVWIWTSVPRVSMESMGDQERKAKLDSQDLRLVVSQLARTRTEAEPITLFPDTSLV